MNSLSASVLDAACQPFLEMTRQAGRAAVTDQIPLHRYDQVFGRAFAPLANTEALAMLASGYGSADGVAFWHLLFPESSLDCLDSGYGDWTEGKACVLPGDQV